MIMIIIIFSSELEPSIINTALRLLLLCTTYAARVVLSYTTCITYLHTVPLGTNDTLALSNSASTRRGRREFLMTQNSTRERHAVKAPIF